VSKFALSRISIGRDWLSTFIITVMTKSTPQGEDFVSRFKLNGKEEVDVRVTVNGVVGHVAEQHGRRVPRRAEP